MMRTQQFPLNIKFELLIFSILFLISFSIIIHHYSTWESSTERLKHESLALFSGDEPFYLELVSTISRFGSFHTDDFYRTSEPDPNFVLPPLYYEVDSCRLHHTLTAKDGHCYNQNLGLPLLLVPGYFLGGILGAMSTLSVIFSFQGVLIYKFSSKFASKQISLLCSLVFSLGTILLSFSGEIYPESVAGFFLLLIIYLKTENNYLKISIVGALLGFMPFLKLGYAIFPLVLLPIMIFVLAKKGNRNGIVHLLTMFTIFIIIYSSYAIVSAPIEKYPGVGGGYKWILESSISNLLEKGDFVTKGLGNLLFGRSYGLLFFSPLALLSLFGIKLLWEKDKILTATIILLSSSFILIHSLIIPFAASWTLPSRYVLPVLPLASIFFALLIGKFQKSIIFHFLIIGASYVSVSFNIIFARTIYGHFSVKERVDIANQVYYGGAKIFPYIGTTIEENNNLWSSSGPFFWIFLGILFTLFGVFTTFSSLKKIASRFTKRQKYVLLATLILVVGILSFSAYQAAQEYYIESKISEIYQELLKRDPDPEGMKHWKYSILEEGKSLAWVEDMIRNSEEGVISKKITEIYQELLKRDPDPEGMKHWKYSILEEGKSLAWVEDMIKNSLEASNLNP